MKEHCVTVKKKLSSTGKLKDMCGSPHMEKGGDNQQGERKYGSESLRHLRQSQINTSGTVPQAKHKQVKVKWGSKSSKLKKTMSEELQGISVKKDSN